MREEKLKINDISIITGVPEDRIRKMVDDNPRKFRYNEINRVRVFNKNAVDMVLKLNSKEFDGKQPDQPPKTIVKPFGDLQERRKPPSVSSVKASTVPLEIYTDMRGLQDNSTRQKRLIDSLKRDITEKEKHIERLNENFSREISGLQKLLESQQAQIDSISNWIDYFEKLTDEMKLSAAEKFMRGWRGDDRD